MLIRVTFAIFNVRANITFSATVKTTTGRDNTLILFGVNRFSAIACDLCVAAIVLEEKGQCD